MIRSSWLAARGIAPWTGPQPKGANEETREVADTVVTVLALLAI